VSEPLNYAVEQRMRMIDFLLHHYGRVGREAIGDYFGLGSASVTRDFALYKSLAPENTVLDPSTKMYIRAPNFARLYP
jgi:hypothetical protein